MGRYGSVLVVASVLLLMPSATAGPTSEMDFILFGDDGTLTLSHGKLYQGEDAREIRAQVDTDDNGWSSVSEWSFYEQVLEAVYTSPEFTFIHNGKEATIIESSASVDPGCWGVVSSQGYCFVGIFFEIAWDGNLSHNQFSGKGDWSDRSMKFSLNRDLDTHFSATEGHNLTGLNETFPTLAIGEDGWEFVAKYTGDWSFTIERDLDGDGFYDRNDTFPEDASEHLDTDKDGIGDNSDPCPEHSQLNDTDEDGIADGCDDSILDGPAGDLDDDGVANRDDKCPGSPDSKDMDFDAIPDACDNDRDGDGVLNVQDRFPSDPTKAEGIPAANMLLFLVALAALVAMIRRP